MNPTQQIPAHVFEMLDRIDSKPTFRERAVLMAAYRCFELNTVLQINFLKAVQLDLPPGAPQFVKDNGDPDMSLARIKNVLRDFVDLGVQNRNLTSNAKLKKFIGMLESINEREAEALILAKDRKLSERWPNITVDLIVYALPGIL